MNPKTQAALLKGAITGGLTNGIINGIIHWFQVRSQSSIFLTVDNITNTEHTVLGGGVMLATSLAAILTMITFFTVKSDSKPAFFPGALVLILKNSFFAFGMMVTVSVIIQRIFGSIAVSPQVSVIITGAIAAVVAGLVDYLTKKELNIQSYNNLNQKS